MECYFKAISEFTVMAVVWGFVLLPQEGLRLVGHRKIPATNYPTSSPSILVSAGSTLGGRLRSHSALPLSKQPQKWVLWCYTLRWINKKTQIISARPPSHQSRLHIPFQVWSHSEKKKLQVRTLCVMEDTLEANELRSTRKLKHEYM